MRAGSGSKCCSCMATNMLCCVSSSRSSSEYPICCCSCTDTGCNVAGRQGHPHAHANANASQRSSRRRHVLGTRSLPQRQWQRPEQRHRRWQARRQQQQRPAAGGAAGVDRPPEQLGGRRCWGRSRRRPGQRARLSKPRRPRGRPAATCRRRRRAGAWRHWVPRLCCCLACMMSLRCSCSCVVVCGEKWLHACTCTLASSARL